MRRAEGPWKSVLGLSMLLNYTGWKNITPIWNCSNEGDEMYLRSASDRQVHAIVNALQIGQLKFGGSIYKTSFKSRCLARGKRTPTNLWRMNSQVHNLLLIRFMLSAINILLTVFPLCSVSCLEIQFLSIFFFPCLLYAGYSMWKSSDNSVMGQVRARQICRLSWKWKYFPVTMRLGNGSF